MLYFDIWGYYVARGQIYLQIINLWVHLYLYHKSRTSWSKILNFVNGDDRSRLMTCWLAPQVIRTIKNQGAGKLRAKQTGTDSGTRPTLVRPSVTSFIRKLYPRVSHSIGRKGAGKWRRRRMGISSEISWRRSDIFVLKHESSIFRSIVQLWMWFFKSQASSPWDKQ